MSCDHSQSRPILFETRDYISAERFNIVRCSACSIALTDTQIDPVSGSKYYPDAYYGKSSRYSKVLATLLNKAIQFRTRLLRMGARPQQKVLDVGCGQGWLLKHFAEQGHEVEGIEVSERAAYHAQSELGITVHIGERAIQELPAAEYDVVCLWHVLEHTFDYQWVMSEVRRVLKPNGRILIGVPNFASLEAKLTRGGWFHLDAPRHLVHFTPNTLQQVLRVHQFSIVDQTQITPEYDLYSFIQSAQNWLGLPMNLLYRMLRRGQLVTGQRKEDGSQVFAKLLVVLSLPFLAIMGALWLPFAYLFGQGSSMTIVAEIKDDQ